MKHEIRHLIRLRPNTLEFLAHLQALGKDAILVTNAHPKALELKVASSGLQQHLKKIISSHEFSLAKENAGFWHKLRDREALDLSRCLFIDDSLNVLNCARNEGVRHTIQILHPDTTQPPRPVSDFPGIHDFDELMIHEQKKYQA